MKLCFYSGLLQEFCNLFICVRPHQTSIFHWNEDVKYSTIAGHCSIIPAAAGAIDSHRVGTCLTKFYLGTPVFCWILNNLPAAPATHEESNTSSQWDQSKSPQPLLGFCERRCAQCGSCRWQCLKVCHHLLPCASHCPSVWTVFYSHSGRHYSK